MPTAAKRRWLSRPFLGGLALVLVAVGGYVVMHVFFFGVPRFTWSTAMGKSEIAYSLANLALVAIGVHSMLRRGDR